MVGEEEEEQEQEQEQEYRRVKVSAWESAKMDSGVVHILTILRADESMNTVYTTTINQSQYMHDHKDERTLTFCCQCLSQPWPISHTLNIQTIRQP